MSNNCLVTKLKGVVDNNNLIQLGHYKAIFDHETDYSLFIQNQNTPVTISVASGSARIFRNGDVEVSFPITINNSTYYKIIPDDGGCVLDFDNKYTAEYLGFVLVFAKNGSFPLEEVKNFSSLTALFGPGLEKALIFDALDEYQKGLVLDKIVRVGLKSPFVTGDIKYIPYIFPNIVDNDNPQQDRGIGLSSSGLTGALEDLVRSYRSIGKTINSLRLRGYVRKADITFNGHNLANESYDNSTLSWTANTMTLNDETINA